MTLISIFQSWFSKNKSDSNLMKYLIVGLGNIGNEYEETRHNIGFKVVEKLAESKGGSFSVANQGSICTIKHKGRQLILLKPSTYMNRSGKAVSYYMQKEKIPVENILIVVDDLALPYGTQRLRPTGSDGGHNGLKSIDEHLSHNKYARLRIGIGNDFYAGQQVDYVLGTWTSKEREDLTKILEFAGETILSFVSIGIQLTMNNFNKK